MAHIYGLVHGGSLRGTLRQALRWRLDRRLMTALLKNFIAEERAATAIEYAFIAALISILLVGGAAAVGTQLDGMFNSAASGFNG